MINSFDLQVTPRPLGFIHLGLIPVGLDVLGFPVYSDPLGFYIDGNGYYCLSNGSRYRLVDGAYYKVQQ